MKDLFTAIVIMILGAMIGFVASARFTKITAKVYYIEPINTVLVEDWLGMIDEYNIDPLI